MSDIFNNLLEDSLFGSMKVHNAANRKLVEESVKIGMQFGLTKLDQAWHLINEKLSPYPSGAGDYRDGFDEGILAALKIIEKLGGMDPLQRGKQ